MTTPYEAFVTYLALKSHFTSKDYDYFKYNGKVRTSLESFENRRDKFFFAKLARKKEVREYIVANFIVPNPSTWIGDLVNESKSEDNYMDWKKRTQSLAYYFEEDLKKLLTSLDENVRVKDSQHPYLLKMLLRKKISIETLVILDDLLGFFPMWSRKLGDDVMWEDICNLCTKYRPFLQYDKKKMRAIALQVFDSEQAAA